MAAYAPKVAAAPSAQRMALASQRLLATLDPSAFIRYALTDNAGHLVKQSLIHEELQDFLTQHAMALIELPRDHGKSFQICGRVLWELGRNPELRIKIVCATEAVARERCLFIRNIIETNRLVEQVFPALRPGTPWTAHAFTIARTSESIGPSVAAFGVGAGTTGTRADLLICDDIVDVHAIHSKVDRDHTCDYFTNNLMNLLEPEGRCWCLCTPWHSDDLNGRLKKNPAFAVLRRPVGAELEPVYPEKWPTERLTQRQAEIGSASFARGYQLRAIAEEETLIRPAWVQFWHDAAPCDTIILSIDPAVSVSEHADRSAAVVLGRINREGAAPEIRVLACLARRIKTPELFPLIDALDLKWNPAVILFESNAAFLGVKDLLARNGRFGPKVKGITQSIDKSSRVAALSVTVENGGFRLQGNEHGEVHESQRQLFDEMTAFPFGEHDDLLDAAATGCAYLLDRREPRAW